MKKNNVYYANILCRCCCEDNVCHCRSQKMWTVLGWFSRVTTHSLTYHDDNVYQLVLQSIRCWLVLLLLLLLLSTGRVVTSYNNRVECDSWVLSRMFKPPCIVIQDWNVAKPGQVAASIDARTRCCQQSPRQNVCAVFLCTIKLIYINGSFKYLIDTRT